MKVKKQIKLNGKQYTVSFGINQTILYCQQRDISVTTMNEEMKLIRDDISITRDLIWSALKDGARLSGKEFDMTPEQVGDMMDEATPEEMHDFFTAFGGGDKPISGKRVTGKKKSSS